MNNELMTLLEQDELLIAGSKSNKEKFHLISNIIQLKLKLNNSSLAKSIYSDLKMLIDFNIAAVKERSYLYDSIRFDVVNKYLSELSQQEALMIAKYLERKLKVGNFGDELIEASELRKHVEIEYILLELRNRNNIAYNLFKLALCASSYNATTILYTITLVIMVKCLILLPAPLEILHIFDVSYDHYSDIDVINHICNIVGSFFKIGATFKISPLNTVAFLLIIFGKIFLYILFVNIIFKEIEKRVNR